MQNRIHRSAPAGHRGHVPGWSREGLVFEISIEARMATEKMERIVKKYGEEYCGFSTKQRTYPAGASSTSDQYVCSALRCQNQDVRLRFDADLKDLAHSGYHRLPHPSDIELFYVPPQWPFPGATRFARAVDRHRGDVQGFRCCLPRRFPAAARHFDIQKYEH